MLYQPFAMPSWPFGASTGAPTRTDSTRTALRPLDSRQANGASPAAGLWTRIAEGVSEQELVDGPEMTMTHLQLNQGAVVAIHRHSSGQGGYVLKGKLVITMPDAQITVREGQVYSIPKGIAHQVRAVEASKVIEIQAPGSVAAQDGIDDEATPASMTVASNHFATFKPRSADFGSTARAARRPRATRLTRVSQADRGSEDAA